MGSVVTQEWLVNQLVNPVNIGVDVGQVHDPTSICVAEVHQVDTGEKRYMKNPEMGHHNDRGEWIPPKVYDVVTRTEYIIKFIKRLPLNTSYPEVAKYLANMLKNDVFQNRNIRVLIDVTGVGRPVYDHLREEILFRQHNADVVHSFEAGVKFQIGRYTLHIKPISFTHGEEYNRKKGTLGKAFFVSKMQTLLQEQCIHGPNISEMQAAVEELKVYEIKVDNNGKDTYGAKTGKHDDLATALGLSCLENPYKEKVSYSEKVY